MGRGGGRGVWKRGVGGGGGKAFHTADASLLGNNTSGAFWRMTGIMIILSYTSENIRRVWRDIQWALCNKNEFRTKHICAFPQLITTTSWPVNSYNHANYSASQAYTIYGQVRHSPSSLGWSIREHARIPVISIAALISLSPPANNSPPQASAIREYSNLLF